jgi:hypothetical protein
VIIEENGIINLSMCVIMETIRDYIEENFPTSERLILDLSFARLIENRYEFLVSYEQTMRMVYYEEC